LGDGVDKPQILDMINFSDPDIKNAIDVLECDDLASRITAYRHGDMTDTQFKEYVRAMIEDLCRKNSLKN
jgi:hypothetical protein